MGKGNYFSSVESRNIVESLGLAGRTKKVKRTEIDVSSTIVCRVV